MSNGNEGIKVLGLSFSNAVINLWTISSSLFPMTAIVGLLMHIDL